MRGEVAGDRAAPVNLGFDDMARQHRAVRIEVSELRAMIDSCRATQRTDGYRNMLAVLVGRLRERLSLHFELEQEGAYVARLRAARPDTAEDIARFAREHDPCLPPRAASPRYANRTARPTSSPRRAVARHDLRQHEQAEDVFLASAGEI
jgi:hypothetical protein